MIPNSLPYYIIPYYMSIYLPIKFLGRVIAARLWVLVAPAPLGSLVRSHQRPLDQCSWSIRLQRGTKQCVPLSKKCLLGLMKREEIGETLNEKREVEKKGGNWKNPK